MFSSGLEGPLVIVMTKFQQKCYLVLLCVRSDFIWGNKRQGRGGSVWTLLLGTLRTWQLSSARLQNSISWTATIATLTTLKIVVSQTRSRNRMRDWSGSVCCLRIFSTETRDKKNTDSSRDLWELIFTRMLCWSSQYFSRNKSADSAALGSLCSPRCSQGRTEVSSLLELSWPAVPVYKL